MCEILDDVCPSLPLSLSPFLSPGSELTHRPLFGSEDEDRVQLAARSVCHTTFPILISVYVFVHFAENVIK